MCHVRWDCFPLQPLERAFSEESVAVKTKSGTHNLMIELTANKFAQTCRELMANFSSPEFCMELNIKPVSKTEDRLSHEKFLAALMFKFVISLVGSLGLSNLPYMVPPMLLLQLTSPSEEAKRKCLDTLKQFFFRFNRIARRGSSR